MEISGKTFGWTAALVTVTGVAYAALLGWDTERELDPATSTLSGPYSAWQVVVLAVVLGLLSFLAGRAGHVWLATVAVALTVAAAFSLVGLTDPDGDGLWPIGAATALAGTGVGVAVVALLGRATRKWALMG